MRKIILTLAAVAAVGTAAVAPAEARGFGRGAAIGAWHRSSGVRCRRCSGRLQ